MHFNKIAASFLLWLAFAQAFAGEPAPGEYLAEHGWGTLNVTRQPGGKLRFVIRSLGANGHSCNVDGMIKDGKAIPGDIDPGSSCEIALNAHEGDIDVVLGQPGQCRYYCGMRASFDGLYVVPAAGCRNAERKATQTKFARLYGAKNYQAAFDTLHPILSNCASTLLWLEEAQIRTDLSVTLYHLGRKEECLSMLKPTIAEHGTTEQAVRDDLPPTDADNFLPLAKAAWYNAKLCSAQ